MTRVLRALQGIFGFTHDPELEHRLQIASVQIEFYFSDQNLENDELIRKEIEKDQDGWVNATFIADFQRMRMSHITPEEVLLCAQNSPFLEADTILQRLRRRTPFISDSRRKYRIICVKGLNEDAELSLQRKFFSSIFKDVKAVHPFYKIANKELVFSGTTYVELGSEEEAKMGAEQGIEYDGGVLSVELLVDVETKKKQEKEAAAMSPKNWRKKGRK